MSDQRGFAGTALITNPTGLHARPAVKLTHLAKRFARGRPLKAPAGQTLFFEAEGPDASEALLTITELVRRNFDEGSQRERQFEGQVASAGLGDGFVVVRNRPAVNGFNGAAPLHPPAERKLLEGALT